MHFCRPQSHQKVGPQSTFFYNDDSMIFLHRELLDYIDVITRCMLKVTFRDVLVSSLLSTRVCRDFWDLLQGARHFWYSLVTVIL